MIYRLLKAIFVASLVFGSVTSAQANVDLTGEQERACEALLCLSSSEGIKEAECQPPIAHYYSIRNKKPSKQIRARKNFLKLCPDSDDSAEMQKLTDSIANAVDRCNPKQLNKIRKPVKVKVCDSRECWHETRYSVVNSFPAYCTAYFNHEYTDIKPPIYVGSYENGTGYWIQK